MYGCIIQNNEYCFYTGIISGINPSYKIYKLVTSFIFITMCKHCIVSMVIDTKYIEKTFYLLCAFSILVCIEHHDGPPHMSLLLLIPFRLDKVILSHEVYYILSAQSSFFQFIFRISTLSQYRL